MNQVRPLLLSLFLGLSALSVGCNHDDSHADTIKAEDLRSLTVDEVAQRIAEQKAGKQPIYLFDNNDQDTFNAGHLPGAKWVAFDKVSQADLPADKAATLVFYCASES